VPGVALKPWPVIVPVPVTPINPLTLGRLMEDAVRSNVNPPTCQNIGTGPELKFQGGMAIVTIAPTFTNPVKSPDRLTTVGSCGGLLPLCQSVTLVAVLTEVVSRCAPPLMLMVPVIRAAVADGVG